MKPHSNYKKYAKMKDSIESKFSNYAKNLNKKGKDIISLGVGEPLFNTPNPVISSAYRAMHDGFTRYSDSRGIFELRKALSNKLRFENQIYVKPNQIIITPGAKMALSLSLMAILESGDEIINIQPCYPSFPQQILIANSSVKVKNLELEKNDFSIDYSKLKKILSKKTKAIILNFPHNPTGKMLSLEEMKKLKQVLSNSECWIISDEIYEYLNFSKKKHLSIASDKDFAKRCITINGFSKAYGMTGWRIGYLATKNKIIGLINKIHQHMNTNVAPFVQKAALDAMMMKRKNIKNFNSLLKFNNDYIFTSIKKSKLLSIVQSDGGLFAFMNIRKTNLNSDEFSYQFLKRFNVATIPGFYFGEKWDDHIRISLVENKKRFKEGVKKLLKFESYFK